MKVITRKLGFSKEQKSWETPEIPLENEFFEELD